MGRQWSELIIDMLEEIDVHLFYIDKVRVRAVCLSWNSALVKLPNYGLPQLPWLLQTVVDNEGEISHGLFNIREQKLYEVDLPQIQRRFLKGSSNGWLIVLSLEEGMKSNNSDICLIDSLTGIQIQLPPRSAFPDVLNSTRDGPLGKEYSINSGAIRDSKDCQDHDRGEDFLSECLILMNWTFKIITSSNPSSVDCVAVVIYGEFCRLAWCTPGQKEWTPLTDSNLVHIDDIIFSNGKLYALNCTGALLEIENIGPNAKVEVVVKSPRHQCKAAFLVESSDGNLIMINILTADGIMDDFQVFKLDRGNSCWHPVKNIGDDMVFLGYNQTFAVPARYFPGYKGNCIYFNDNPILWELCDRNGDVDIGIYNLEDGSIERIPGFPIVQRTLWPQPVWVMPPIDK